VSEAKYSVAETGPKVESFLNRVLPLAGLDVKFEIVSGEAAHQDFETPDLLVRFSGRDVEWLLANKAEAMLALEQLTMEMLRMSSEEHSRICFDANDYRLLRIEELRMSAASAAEKVRKTRVPFQFNPMNSRERRIIHLVLRDHKDLRSESLGQGPYRHVVILPADMPSLPEPPRPSGPPMRRPGGPGGPPRGDRPPFRGGGGGDRGGRGGDRRSGGGGFNRGGPGGGDRRGGGGGPRRDRSGHS
jgi:spoIIIJ-associated protein